MKKIFLSLILFLAAGAAQAYMEVDPLSEQIKVPAGGSYSGTIKVKNTTAKILEIDSHMSDWKYIRHSGQKQFFPPGTFPFSCANWITMSSAKFAIPPGQTRDVRYSISVPTDARGGYYAEIQFSALIQDAGKKEGVNVNVAMEMGTILLVEIDKTQKPKLTVKNFSAASPKANQPFDLKLTVKNEGNVRVEAKGRAAVTDMEGNAIGWTQFPDVKTLPGDEWSVSVPWSWPLLSGTYRLVGTFELSSGGILVKEEEIKIP